MLFNVGEATESRQMLLNRTDALEPKDGPEFCSMKLIEDSPLENCRLRSFEIRRFKLAIRDSHSDAGRIYMESMPVSGSRPRSSN